MLRALLIRQPNRPTAGRCISIHKVLKNFMKPKAIATAWAFQDHLPPNGQIYNAGQKPFNLAILQFHNPVLLVWRFGGKLDDYDLVEVLDLTDASLTEPLCLLEKLGGDLNTHVEGLMGGKPHLARLTMVNDFRFGERASHRPRR